MRPIKPGVECSLKVVEVCRHLQGGHTIGQPDLTLPAIQRLPEMLRPGQLLRVLVGLRFTGCGNRTRDYPAARQGAFSLPLLGRDVRILFMPVSISLVRTAPYRLVVRIFLRRNCFSGTHGTPYVLNVVPTWMPSAASARPRFMANSTRPLAFSYQ
jgi:hypothetical protein